jgi:transcription antitermination factor NusG
LRSRGLEAFAPFYRVRRRRADRNVDLEVPIFPSYVFCRFEPTRRLPILQTSGVVFIVSRDGHPEPIDSLEVASIQKIANSGRAIQPWDFLQSGQRVKIRAGSLAGAEGRLVRIRNRDRLVVSVTVLQRSVAVEIDQDMVEPIY